MGGPNHGELLVEFGGRACYRSWEPGLNPNVTQGSHRPARILRQHPALAPRQRAGARELVLCAARRDHALFTHELVRHRAGSAFSQESLRYVRLADIGFRVPPALEPMRERVLSIVEQLEEFQLSAARELGIDEEGVPFHVKKEVTSRDAPARSDRAVDRHHLDGQRRTLRHVIEMRTTRAPRRSCGSCSTRSPASCWPRRRGCSRTSAARTTAPGCPSTTRSSPEQAPLARARRSAASGVHRARAPGAEREEQREPDGDHEQRRELGHRDRAAAAVTGVHGAEVRDRGWRARPRGQTRAC